jgi:O-antigen ligase
MTARATKSIQPPGRPRAAAVLETLAWLLLLAVVASRPFVAELPYRVSLLKQVPAALGGAAGSGPLTLDSSDEARVLFAMAIVAAAAMWATAGAIAGRLVIRHRWLAAMAAALLAWTAASAAAASDQRDAWLSWLDLAGAVTAGVVAVQLAREPRRRGQMLAVLAGVALALTVKGLWEYFVEAPARIADFEANRAERLAAFGITPGSVEARLFQARLRDRAPLGYFTLTNLLAAAMLILIAAGAGAALARLAAARRAMPHQAQRRVRGEIPLELLAAVLLAGLPLAAAAVLALTGSRGALAAGGIAGGGAAAAWLFRGVLSRHWRKAVVAAVLAVVLAWAGVVAVGVSRGALPTKTMTFRWLYWTASARIAAENPLLGVGPGNFGPAYQQARSPAGEEEAKAPHNVVAHAAAQYGLPGAVLLLGAVGYLLIGSTRPRPKRPGDAAIPPALPAGGETGARSPLVLVALVASAVLAVRVGIGMSGAAHPLVIVFDGVAPAVLAGLGVLLAAWSGDRLEVATLGRSRAARWLLAAALAAFFVHSMVEFGFSAAGTATLFFAAAGVALAWADTDGAADCPAALGRNDQGTPPPVGRIGLPGWPFAALLWAGVLAIAVLVWPPVNARLAASQQALAAAGRGDAREAVAAAVAAAQADQLDPIAAADAAKVIAATCQASPPSQRAMCLRDALAWARRAIDRDPADPGNYRLASAIAWQLAELEAASYDEALALLAGAVQRDPAAAELRLLYAQRLCQAGQFDACLAQLDAAERIEAQLIRPSFEEFSAEDRDLIDRLRTRAAPGQRGGGGDLREPLSKP